MAISNVIFDLGAALLEWKPNKIATEFTNDRDLQNKIEEHILSHPDWLELDKGALVESDAYSKFADRCDVNPGTIKQFFNHVRQSLKLKEDTKLIFNDLLRANIPLYCLSNMSVDNFEFLQSKYDFFSEFKGIEVSGYLKMAKPDVKILHHILNKYKLIPEHTLFIDDSEHNIKAAETLKVNCIHFTSATECRGELINRFGLLGVSR